VYRECLLAIAERGETAHVVFKMSRSKGFYRRLWDYGPRGEVIKEIIKEMPIKNELVKVLVIFHAAEVVAAIDKRLELQARKEQSKHVPDNHKKRKQPK
jgi:hypothetical protein